MDYIIYFLLGLAGILFGAVGIMGSFIHSERKELEKICGEAEKQRATAEGLSAANEKVNEVKKENEKKKQKVHSGNNLDIANAAIDILRQ